MITALKVMKIAKNSILLSGLGALLLFFSTFFSCGDEDGGSSVNYLVMEMKRVNLLQGDTLEYSFSYQNGVLKQATLVGEGINETLIAEIDGNGKVTEAGSRRFEWEGDRLVKIIYGVGIWTDLTYDGDKLILAEMFNYDQNNEIQKLNTLDLINNGINLSQIENIDARSDVLLNRYTFAGFDNKVNVFRAIWWFHYIGTGMNIFGSGMLPEALFTENNPGSYKYETPLNQFEITFNYTYTFDELGRVASIEFDLGDTYQLIFSY